MVDQRPAALLDTDDIGTRAVLGLHWSASTRTCSQEANHDLQDVDRLSPRSSNRDRSGATLEATLAADIAVIGPAPAEPGQLLRSRARAVILDLVSRAYRQRLAFEWRAAVLVATLAVAVPVLAFTRLVDATWLLVVVGAVLVLIAVGLMLLSYFRPVSPPPVPGRWRDRDVTEAQVRVRRGEPVEPPELQAATIATLRRGLRISLLQFGIVFPMLGCSWALRLGEPGFAGGFAYVGMAVMLLAIGGLAWSGVVQRHLDRLEDARDTSLAQAASTATEESDCDRP